MKIIKHRKGETSGLRIYFSAAGAVDQISYQTEWAIRRAIFETLRHEDFSFNAEISVTVCDNEYIHALNLKYRQIDRPTDVLSFPMIEVDEGIPHDSSSVLLGDIVISQERANEQAGEIGHSLIREIQFLCVHSVLHLLGYDHEVSPEADEEMCRVQREIMDKIEKLTDGEITK